MNAFIESSGIFWFVFSFLMCVICVFIAGSNFKRDLIK